MSHLRLVQLCGIVQLFVFHHLNIAHILKVTLSNTCIEVRKLSVFMYTVRGTVALALFRAFTRRTNSSLRSRGSQ